MWEGRGQRRGEKRKKIERQEVSGVASTIINLLPFKTESRVRLLMGMNQMVHVSLSKYLLHLLNSCLASFHLFSILIPCSSLSASTRSLPSAVCLLHLLTCHFSTLNL